MILYTLLHKTILQICLQHATKVTTMRVQVLGSFTVYQTPFTLRMDIVSVAAQLSTYASNLTQVWGLSQVRSQT